MVKKEEAMRKIILAIVLVGALGVVAGCNNCNPDPCCEPVYASPCCPAPSQGVGYGAVGAGGACCAPAAAGGGAGASCGGAGGS